MSKFVIMETVGGFGQPVAIRDNQEIAMACCMKLANLRSQKVRGVVEALEDGARFSAPEATYTVVEVENVSVDFD